MKTKHLLLLLLLAALCPWTAMAQKTHVASTTSSTAMTWAEFADIVNNGTSYEGVTVYLDEDITATTMAGTNENNCFKGTLEGNNHTLTFNYTTNGWYMAPFRYLNGATIRNLKVNGTITANSPRCGGLVGQCYGNTTITNCLSDITINSSLTSDGTYGGFVSIVREGTTTFEGCAFTGRLLGSGTYKSGGFVGSTVTTVVFNNCVFAPTEVTIGLNESATFSREFYPASSVITTNNSYYTYDFNDGTSHVGQGKQRYTITAAEPVSVALNGTATGHNMSHITAYSDTPGLLYNDTIIAGEGEQVSLNLDGSNIGYLVDHGTLSGTSNPYTLTMAAYNTMVSPFKTHIANTSSSTAMTWVEFANYVNNGMTYEGMTVYLNEDITATIMVGTNENNCFKGTLEGNNHTLTFNYTTNGWYMAPFRYLNGATIQNLKVDGTITANSPRCGGLAGHCYGDNTIINCLSNITINSSLSSDGTYGGFVSVVRTGTTTLEGCSFTGRLLGSGTYKSGGLVGITVTAVVFNNCVFAPKEVTIGLNNSATFSRFYDENTVITINNSYYTYDFNDGTTHVGQGKQRYTIKAAAPATVALNGTATNYNVSHITACSDTPGLLYKGTVIAGSGEQVSLNLGGGSHGYYANHGTLTGTSNPYTLTMEANNTMIFSEMTIVNYELHDSWGDGWTGNYILVVDCNCEIVDELTIQNGFSASGTVEVYGSYAQFLWYRNGSNTYPDETSWVFTNAAGDVLFSGAGSFSMANYDVLYTIDNTPVKLPTGLTATEVGPYSTKLSWTENGTATAWQIMLDEDEDNLIEANSNPFVLTGLDPETDYNAQVRAVGAEGTSFWTCGGVDFTTTVPCPNPTGLAASDVTALSALISWNGWGESYDLRYMPVNASTKGKANNGNLNMQLMANPNTRPNANTKGSNLRDGWYYYDDGVHTTSIGRGGTDVYWGIMLPAGMTSETSLTKVSFYSMSGYDETITLYVYAGGTDAPGTLLYTEEIEPEAADDFQIFTLATPVEVDPIGNLWIVLKQYGEFPAACCANTGDANGRWYSLDGEAWADVAGYGLEYTWMIRAYLEGEAVLPWIDVTGINANEYELTNLDPETVYTVQVRANCGDDGIGEWTTIQFTTGSLCDTPFDLEVADVTYNAATLNWYGSQDSYNVRYRTPKVREEVYFTNFNVAPDTLVAEGWNWEGFFIYGIHDPIYNIPGDENYCLQMGYSTTNETYIFSPELPEYAEGALLEFYYFGFRVANTFQMGYSSTTADTTAFTWSEPINAPLAQYTLFSEVLPVGTKYVAFKTTAAASSSCIFIDNFGIYNIVTAAGEWIEATANESTITITGLTPETEYEWQVQGIYPNCGEDGLTEWSNVMNFTTLEQTSVTQTIALQAGWNWFSTYIDITLDDLKAALVAALPGTTNITITSQSNGSTTYNGTRWRGQLNTIDLSQMYKVQTTAASVMTLQGIPVNPAEHPVTIHYGNNWIAYPFSQGMSLTDAFAGFAASGDMVTSQSNGSSTYTNRWRGTLNTLEPGKGYIYYSNSTAPRTLIFVAPTK